MPSATSYLEDRILNCVFRGEAAYKPASIWIGLFTSVPSDAGGGAEVAGGNYARVQVTQSDLNWNAPSGSPRQISNVNAISFGTVTWSASLVAYGVFDASTSGNLLLWNSYSTPVIVSSGDSVSFPGGSPGNMIIQVN